MHVGMQVRTYIHMSVPNPKPETRNPKPDRNPIPETRNGQMHTLDTLESFSMKGNDIKNPPLNYDKEGSLEELNLT